MCIINYMESNFWSELNKPFFVMAPMEDVTDIAFRQMFAKYSPLRSSASKWVTFTEFVSADGLVLAPQGGQEKILSKLRFEENERPIVAQIFGANAENIERASEIIAKLGFDGIDINMGCPDKNVEKQGAGAALIRNPKFARELIRAIIKGIEDSKRTIPVSVKTRIGYNKNEIDAWIVELLKEKPAALTVHLRTRKEMSDVPAHWELMPEIIKLRDKISPETLIIGNGDVKSLQDAKEKACKYGCDGIMIGRALFGNPTFFNIEARPLCWQKRRLRMLSEHLGLFDNYFLSKNYKGYHVMKKHFKAYVSGWKGAKELRVKLMNTNSPAEAKKILSECLL